MKLTRSLGLLIYSRATSLCAHRIDLMKPPALIAFVGLFAFHAAHSSGDDESLVLSAQPLPQANPAPHTVQFGMDDLMTMLVSPRHIKLYYAGTAKNWELADFELRQLRAALRRITDTMPFYLNQDVAETVEALMAIHFDTTESAIAAGDSARFAAAYQELTDSCNACHTYLEHSFLIVKVPPAQPNDAYPNQSFANPDL